jgi:phage-related protein
VKLAQGGKPFNQLLDRKAVHEAFDSFFCEVSKKKETVWRYRHGAIRILFYYAADKVVLLTHTLAKRSDKLSEKDKNLARQAVIDFLAAAQSSNGLQWLK